MFIEDNNFLGGGYNYISLDPYDDIHYIVRYLRQERTNNEILFLKIGVRRHEK